MWQEQNDVFPHSGSSAIQDGGACLEKVYQKAAESDIRLENCSSSFSKKFPPYTGRVPVSRDDTWAGPLEQTSSRTYQLQNERRRYLRIRWVLRCPLDTYLTVLSALSSPFSPSLPLIIFLSVSSARSDTYSRVKRSKPRRGLAVCVPAHAGVDIVKAAAANQ